MILKHLKLQNFRNYSQKEWQFSPESTLLVGPNAAGKTNILEAIYLLATGKSPRVSLEQEMIRESQEWARINGQTEDGQKNKNNLEIILTRGSVAGRSVAKKRYILNGVPRRMTTFIGMLKAVLFRPEDLDIILGTPSERRLWLNNILAQTDYDYRRSLLTYKKGLKQRNRILLKIREGETDARQLYFWDQLLIKNGEIIHRKRQELIDYINNRRADKELNVDLVYDFSVISRQRLDQYYQASVAAGSTLVGPHRDDIVILKIKDQKSKITDNTTKKSLAHYGSRGEQRMGVLCLKLAELEFLSQQSGERPVLLLDDIFSELDEPHRALVLTAIGKQQTIMTSTETDWFRKDFLAKIKVIEI